MNCPKCLSAIPDDAVFCSECGARTSEAIEKAFQTKEEETAQMPGRMEDAAPSGEITYRPEMGQPLSEADVAAEPAFQSAQVHPFALPRAGGGSYIPIAPNRRRSPVFTVLFTLVCLMLVTAVVFYIGQTARVAELRRENQRLASDLAMAETGIDNLTAERQGMVDASAALRGELERVMDQNAAMGERISDLEDQLFFFENDFESRYGNYEDINEEYWFYHNEACCIENDGTALYHRYSCPDFLAEYFWVLNTNRAEAEGYLPCPTCWDPLY